MYLTGIYKNETNENFDWDSYFSRIHSGDIMKQINPNRIIAALREHLKEDKFLMGLVLSRLMRDLLAGIKIKSPKILELGAGTGFLTRWLISQYGGRGVLVDKSSASFDAYNAMKDSIKKQITYVNADLFDLELTEVFDLVCSFGLIEHFKDKSGILAVHRKYAAANGVIIILVPLNSPLTRAFLEVHPELNLGYRELLTKKEVKRILKQNHLEVIRTIISQGYCYDFVGAVCV